MSGQLLFQHFQTHVWRFPLQTTGINNSMDTDKIKISAEAVQDATGRSWIEWFLLLDSGNAYELDHRGIVTFLENHIDSAWWRQTVAVEYEKIYGMRTTGETADGSFEVGVQKSVPVAPKKAWELIVSRDGIRAWLGEGARPDPTKGYVFETADGVKGEFRVVKKMSHVRLTWQPSAWKAHSTLQVRVIPKGPGKSVISFHHEGLPEERDREEMRRHWKEVLAALEEIGLR